MYELFDTAGDITRTDTDATAWGEPRVILTVFDQSLVEHTEYPELAYAQARYSIEQAVELRDALDAAIRLAQV